MKLITKFAFLLFALSVLHTGTSFAMKRSIETDDISLSDDEEWDASTTQMENDFIESITKDDIESMQTVVKDRDKEQVCAIMTLKSIDTMAKHATIEMLEALVPILELKCRIEGRDDVVVQDMVMASAVEYYDRIDILKLLLEEGGADPNFDFYGSCIRGAVKLAHNGDYRALELLKTYKGLNVNPDHHNGDRVMLGEYGNKAPLLVWAIRERDAKLVGFLLDVGADPTEVFFYENPEGNPGETPLSVAEKVGNDEIINLIKDAVLKTLIPKTA